MRSANLFGPLKGLCPHKALIGLTQASGLAGGFDWVWTNFLQKMGYRSTSNQGIRPDVEMLGADNSHRSQKHSWRSFAEFLRFHFLCFPLPFLLLEKFSLSRFVVLNTFARYEDVAPWRQFFSPEKHEMWDIKASTLQRTPHLIK